ncbi:MAG: LPS export ABC transporter permease LptF [Gammaproteobacteria bacterium]|nr:LPS export ABC transporter permease LptF [Gammaproteobacteria bacterium]MBT8437599.1 LPS export ABC transporter permease LptF [Gammaproteobacteria bacterium]
MNNIITTYLSREIIKTSAATMLVLYIILMSNALGRVLADIADGDIPQQALWPVMLSQSVNTLALLLPISFFLGIIFAFGRMYKDHEIVVMNACGIGYRDFYKPVAVILLPLLVFSAYASLSLNARMQVNALAIIDQAENQHQFHQIKAGQFNQSEKGDTVFFMGSLSADKLELQEVIISQTDRDVMILETAESGRHQLDEQSGDLFLVVGPGQRVEGIAGQKDFKIIDYDQHGILVEKQSKPKDPHVHSIEKTIAELWSSNLISDRVELQWRIAIPVVLTVLALLAVPLSYISPRQGRFGKVGYALLVFIAYLNLLAVTRTQLEAGTFPMVVNFWWVHLLFIAVTCALIYRRNKGVLFRQSKPA